MGREFLKRARPWLERVGILLILVFLGRYAYLRWQEVREVELSLSIPHAAAGFGALFLFYLFFSWTWQRILNMNKARPENAPSSAIYRAFFLAFVTRYLPAGNVLTIGGRVEFHHRLGGSRSRVLESVYYEQLYLTVGAFVLGLGAYVTAGGGLLPPSWWGTLAWFIALVALVGTTIVAAGAEKALRVGVRLFGINRLNHLGMQLEPLNKLELVGRFLLINLLQGGSAFLMLWSVYPALDLGFATVLVVVAAYPMSRFVGQMVAVIPGGLGIREGAYTFVLGALMPVQPVLVSAALLRLGSVVLEFVLLGVMTTLEQMAEPVRQNGGQGGEGK